MTNQESEPLERIADITIEELREGTGTDAPRTY